MGRAQRRPGCGAYPRQGVADLHGEPNTRDVDAKRQLGEFLQTRRSQLTPEDVGLTTYGDRALFAGDLLHSPLQVLHPGQSSCFCEDAATAETSRQRLLGWAADH